MNNTTAATDLPLDKTAAPNQWLVIGASSLGTVFEWYDFYIYGLLATILASQFFSGVNEVTGFIFALATFAAGFAVRPFGALVFGRLGDLVGRKHTFLITMSIMGGATFLVGLLPSYASVGIWAPIALVLLRLLQGLALGGEYGGAATYVAEHAPPGKRGLYTSWIQTTATLGLFAALLVVIGTRTGMGEDAFKAWGWRIPFLVSLLLLIVSLWIRMKLDESPGVHEHEARGHDLEGAARGGFRPLEQFEDRLDRAARGRDGTGRRMVHGTVLRALLSGAHPACRRRDHQHFDRHRARARNSRVHLVRLAVGSNRPQTHHPRRMPDRRCHLHRAVPRAHLLRQSRVGRGSGEGAGHRDRRSCAMLRAVRSGGQEQVRLDVLRHCEELPGQGRGFLSARRRIRREALRRSRPARRRLPRPTRAS